MTDTLKILLPIIVVHAVVLVAIVIVIKRLLLSDTTRAIKRIGEVEKEIREKEDKIRRDIEEHEKEFVRKRAEAEEELQRQREQSERQVSAMREEVIGDARKEGERIINAAKRNEEKLRAQVLQEMEEKAVEYGAEVFKLVLSESVTAELNSAFVAELLDALEEIDSSNITVDTTQAEFTSSHPLEVAQRQRLQALLKVKFEADVEVAEKIDERLLAGLVFKLGSLEIDGSLSTRFKEAASELKKTVNA